MAKKSVALFLTCIVIFQLGAVWAVFSCAIWFHKQHRQMRLSDQSRWEVFTMRAEEFNSDSAKNEEMEIGGKMYDVVSIQSLDNFVIITAVADQAEDHMKRSLDGLSQRETGWSNLAKLTSSYGTSVFIPEKVFQISAEIREVQSFHVTFQDNNVHCGVRSENLRPPCL